MFLHEQVARGKVDNKSHATKKPYQSNVFKTEADQERKLLLQLETAQPL